MKAALVLEDGRSFVGRSFGAIGQVGGEVCFNTSMAGYQEVLTDPSYRGQIVAMTYPLIGNYGTNAADAESRAVHPRGFVVREVSPIASNWMSEVDLPRYLAEAGVLGLEDVDTRALTRHVREKGALRGVLAAGEDLDLEGLARAARDVAPLEDQDLVGEVTTAEPYTWDEPFDPGWVTNDVLPPPPPGSERPHVVAYDLGMKLGILRGLARSGCRITVVPARTPASEVLGLKPDGVFLSNGPGDPAVLGDVVEQARRLVEATPVFGICLGHQVLGQVFGARTYKLKFGHRGGNHPVKDLTTGHVEITTQNHGYAVDGDSLVDQVQVTHLNLNDETVEGLTHRELPAFSVQYHPEASPGPHDACHLFQRFAELLRARRSAA